jgi:predicted Zn-dependent peptidase
MLLEGTNSQKGEDIHEHLDFYGAFTQLEINSDRATVSLYTLNEHFDAVFPVFTKAVNNAVFPEELIKVTIDQKRQAFAINREKVEFIARDEFFKNIFINHPYGQSVQLSDFDNIHRADLVEFHKNQYKKGKLKIYVSGQKPENLQSLLVDAFCDFQPQDRTELSTLEVYDIFQKKHLPKRDAIQSAIRIGRPFFNSNHKDCHSFKFLSGVLGGYFGSRLMHNLREDKGLTYGISAICVQQEEQGYFVISTEVKGESTELALKEIYNELNILRNELISQEELSLVKSYIMGQILKSADGPFSQSTLLKNMHIQSTGFEFYSTYQHMLDNLDSEHLKSLANTYLKEQDLCEVVVGNISF